MDNFKEEVAVRRNRTLYDLLYMLCFATMIVSALLALVTLQGVLSMVFEGSFHPVPLVVLVLFGGMGFLLWRYKDELRSEYEYTFTNGILDVAQVLNNKKRRYLTSLNMKDVTAAGPVKGAAFGRYLSMPDVKKHNWFLNRDAHLYFYFFTKNAVKHLMVVELSGEMAALTNGSRYMGHGVWQG